MTQKDLADKLNKKPSEINKWLKGEHNYTLKSIARLQVELGEAIIAVPDVDKNFGFRTQSRGKIVQMRVEHCAKSEKPYSMTDFDSFKNVKQRKSKAYAS